MKAPAKVKDCKMLYFDEVCYILFNSAKNFASIEKQSSTIFFKEIMRNKSGIQG